MEKNRVVKFKGQVQGGGPNFPDLQCGSRGWSQTLGNLQVHFGGPGCTSWWSRLYTVHAQMADADAVMRRSRMRRQNVSVM